MTDGTCPDCGNPLSSEAVACPKCGRLTGRNRNRAIGAMVLALVVGSFAAFNTYVLHRSTSAPAGPVHRRAVHSGHREQIDFFYSVHVDCSIEGYPEITIVRPPGQGSVSAEQGEAYPQFTRDNVRFDCDRNQVGATLVLYESKPSFRGRDSFTVNIRFPDSVMSTVSYVVDVM